MRSTGRCVSGKTLGSVYTRTKRLRVDARVVHARWVYFVDMETDDKAQTTERKSLNPLPEKRARD